MNGIDPKFIFWFGVWTNLLTLIAGYGVEHAPPLVAQYAPTVQWVAAVLAQANGVVLTALVGISSTKAGPLVSVPASAVKPIILLAVILGSLFAFAGDARAQIKLKPLTGNVVKDFEAANQQTKAAITGQPAPDPAAPVPYGFKMLVKLTPDNLEPTIKKCLSDVNSQLVGDTQRALDSAKAYGGSGDGDAVNCLTPALAIFKAGVQVPVVPATATTPEVPAQDPGPILLYQKYREFTLSGALTACQAWFNGPINATTAAGIAGIGTAVGAAALLAPK